jgi:hypothetical protein
MGDAHGRRDRETLEITIVGESEVVIRYVERNGQTLLQERLVVSGPPGVMALRHVPLSIGTVRGPVALAPVIMSTSAGQSLAFNGGDAVRFVRRRCQVIRCRARVARDAARGVAPAPDVAHAVPAEPDMTAIVHAATAGRRTGKRRR